MKEPSYSLSDYREEVQRCMRCGFCRPLCPSWELIGWETGSPRGRMQMIKAMLDGKIVGDEFVMDRMFKCALCGYCLWRCPAGVKTTDAIKSARAQLVDRGLYPSAVTQIAMNLENNHNIYELEPSARAEWPQFTGVEDIVTIGGKADLIYFAGCVSSLSGRAMDIATSTALILDSFDVDWTFLGEDEWCCGNPLLLSGKTEYAKTLVEHNVEKIMEVGAKAVVTSCAGCYRTLIQDYPRLIGDIGFKVYHISDFIESQIGKLRPKLIHRMDMPIVYHDPCELGRLSGVYASPRAVLSSIPGIKLLELPKNRQTARCCGGGGVLKATNPNMALQLAMRKVGDAHAVGGGAIVSACPACKLNIMDGVAERGEEFQVLDLTELVVKSMGMTTR